MAAEPRAKASDVTDAQAFWGSLYDAAYRDRHDALDGAGLGRLLDRLEQLFAHRQHLIAREVPRDLGGLRVLDIGCGAGAHSLLLARRGARVTALDLTAQRAAATARKFRLLPHLEGTTVQGDAGALPFPDATFDFVYSNGVLHHTPRIVDAVSELRRVLKPGGRAAVMLYARNSLLYRGVLLPVRGILQGGLFRDRRWLGHATEWMAARPQTVSNPWTAVFSAAEARRLLSGFSGVAIRKGSFTFEQIPVVGRVLGGVAARWTGWNDAGVLVYDRPWRNETQLELRLGRTIGWALNIEAIK